MKVVNKWSYGCANSLASALNENHYKRSAYYYSFQIVIGTTVEFLILAIVSLLLGVFIPALIISLSFAALRLIAGGYHMDTYSKCLYVSLGLFIAAALIDQHTYLYWTLPYLAVLIAVTALIGLYVLIRYAPKDTPNKPITNPRQKRKLKTVSLIYLLVWLVASLCLLAYGYNMWVISLSFGILLEFFSISPTGHRFFDLIKVNFDTRKV
jgi:Membrane protein putatively involved in post-translational modification of the autoinducing quorum-sensing peptide